MHISRWAGAVAAMAVVLGGCGGGGDARPSADELSAAIKAGSSGLGVGEAAADCVAQVLVESDLSDDALRRYTGDNDDERLSAADRQAFDAFLDRAETTCKISRGAG